MTEQELRDELSQMKVTPPNDSLRACLYLRHIKDTYNYFNTGLAAPAPTGLGTDYAFVQYALQDPELLNSLAKVLDDFLCPAIQAHLLVNQNNQLPNFQTYYVNNFLNANYATNVTTFFNTYQVTRNILNRLATNFRKNIKEACQRILQDRNVITQTFAPPGATLLSLVKIKSTGSDFHKGGKQVLILTFHIQPAITVSTSIIFGSYFNLIYKPSDLETDCLIVGESAAVNAIHHTPQPFQANSLFEILNAGITAALQTNANLSLELLPTYKILPIDYTSNQPVGYPVNIRRAYGYIEYLQHEHDSGAWGFYSLGSSDYKIFPTQNKADICRKFYRLIGQISAIAAVFSISDLHAENLIVKNYLPHLIDLEISLTLPIVDISNTVLYNHTEKAGVNGERKEDDFAYLERRDVNGLRIDDTQKPAYGQNRLMTVDPDDYVEPGDGLNPKNLCKGFRDMIDVIQSLNTPPHNNDLNTWIGRVNNVLVRNLPLATKDFRTLVNSSVNQTHCTNLNGLALIIDVKRGDLFAQWQVDNNLNPDFLALQDDYVEDDFDDGDIPIFYHRIGAASLNIVDSRGDEVLSPGNISYRADENSPLQNHAYALPNGRTTFFAASPFTTNVVNTQLADITNPVTKGARVLTLVGEILNQLGLASSATDINNILA